MVNLRNSLLFLFFYLLMVFGIAQINFIEENVLNFEPAFFIILGVVVMVGLYGPSRYNISIYVFMIFWAVVFGLIWVFHWRLLEDPPGMQILGIEFLLIEISGGLAYDVGRQMESVRNLFEGLSASTYPNRTIEISAADDRVSAELTRSRRYHHPLSLLIVEFKKSQGRIEWKNMEGLQRDLLHRFALAKVGQIIGERARETDLILRDRSGRFLLLCPETTHENALAFAERINQAVHENMGAAITWSSASFPDEALTFDELVERAEQRLPLSDTTLVADENATQGQ